MGFTQGKRPSGVKIGKVHKIMNGNTVVFRDATSSLDDLIARVQENPVHLMLADVTIEEPGHPIEGENWRPQLAPYKPWVHDAALDETEELDGTDGDLLIVDRAVDPYDGCIAVCYVDGEFTVKRVRLEKGCAWLMPSNPKYRPLRVDAGNEFLIWGVVRHVIKSFK